MKEEAEEMRKLISDVVGCRTTSLLTALTWETNRLLDAIKLLGKRLAIFELGQKLPGYLKVVLMTDETPWKVRSEEAIVKDLDMELTETIESIEWAISEIKAEILKRDRKDITKKR